MWLTQAGTITVSENRSFTVTLHPRQLHKCLGQKFLPASAKIFVVVSLTHKVCAKPKDLIIFLLDGLEMFL